MTARTRGGVEEAVEEVVEEAEAAGSRLWAGLRRVGDFFGDLTGVGPFCEAICERVREWWAGDGDVAFTVALISLSAKMAKADGVVTADEIETFRRVVEVPEGEERNVERLFDLARRDVAGYEAHARRISELAGGDAVFLADVLTGLFHIAAADAYVHEAELAFLERVAEIFGLDRAAFGRIAGRFVRFRREDPYAVLGVDPSASDDEVKRAWRAAVKECHPDRHFAHGLPREAMAILTDRLAALNGAWEQVRIERGLGSVAGGAV
ncbi:MAG: DnaJ family molecular chaperone [Phyllobacteriaceae bacterium]|nr:DnaJ family molecular chaperone [Phyllobacteriaceae bacterium]